MLAAKDVDGGTSIQEVKHHLRCHCLGIRIDKACGGDAMIACKYHDMRMVQPRMGCPLDKAYLHRDVFQPSQRAEGLCFTIDAAL